MAKLTELKALLDAARRERSPAEAAETAKKPHRPPPGRSAPAARAPSATQAPPASGIAAPRSAAAHGASHARSPAASAPQDAVDLSQVFADVAPMPSSNRARMVTERPLPHPKQRIADEADALEASKFGSEPAPTTWEIGQELEADQTFLRRGLGTDVLSRLRRGHWALQGELDLHRLNSDEARDALADFLLLAEQRGWRCVRVIHGKGLSSPDREPVLKGKVRRWLARWDAVLAYCEAPRHAGGSGAVIVLLRAPRT